MSIGPDDLIFSDLAESESNDVVKFMAEHFYPREPLSTGLHMSYEDNKEWIHESVKDWAKSGASIVARDPSNKNRIAGTCLATILTRSQNTSFDEALSSPKLKVKTLHTVLSVLEASVNFFTKFNVDKILEIAMITVPESYSGRGIGGRLVQESESRGKKLKCELATAQATHIPSQRLLQKLGYISCYEMDYESFCIDGQKVFDMDKMLGTPSAKVMAHELLPPSQVTRSIFGRKVFKSRSEQRSQTLDKPSENDHPSHLDRKNSFSEVDDAKNRA